MRMMKKTIIFGIVLLCASGAFATSLPISSHYEGSTYDTTYGVIIEFAVYDTQLYPSEYSYTLPGADPGRFVYAYQIICSPYNTGALDYFAVLDIGSGSIASGDVIGSQDDGSGVGPTDEYFTDSTYTEAAWEFENGSDGLLVADSHSYFLVYSSDYDWVEGTYTLSQTTDNDPFPSPPDVPEPLTIALLGSGGAILLSKRKKWAKK